jgi:hypothetical protein
MHTRSNSLELNGVYGGGTWALGSAQSKSPSTVFCTSAGQPHGGSTYRAKEQRRCTCETRAQFPRQEQILAHKCLRLRVSFKIRYGELLNQIFVQKGQALRMQLRWFVGKGGLGWIYAWGGSMRGVDL